MKRLILAVAVVVLVASDAGAQRFGGGSRSSRSFSGGSRSSSSFSGGSSRSSFSGSSRSSFSGGSARSSSSSTSPRSVSSTAGASIAAARSSARSSASKAATTARASTGWGASPSASSAPSGPRVTVSREKIASRSQRTTVVYREVPQVYHHYSTYRYSDPYSPMLTGFLLGRLTSPQHHAESVRYIYNHWDEMDQARRDQLLKENAGLRAELAAMSGARDPGYRMAGVDADVLYSDAAVAAEGSGWFGTILGWILAISVVGIVVYVVFVHDWR